MPVVTPASLRPTSHVAGGPQTADARSGPCDVLHVSSVHPFNDVRILYRECMPLQRAGFDVRAAFFDVQGESLGGVPLIDMGRRPASRIARAIVATRRMRSLVAQLRPRAVHLHDPELLPLALMLKRDGLVVFYDAHEDLPKQVFHKPWIPAWLRWPVSLAVDRLLPMAYDRVDGLVVAARHIHDTSRLDHQRVVLRNMALARQPEAPSHESGFDRRERAVAYVGAISASRDTQTPVRAALQCGATVYLADHADPAYLRELQALDPQRVRYEGIIAPPDVGRLLDRCRAGLAVLPPTPAYVEAIPSKLFDYLQAGLPSVVSDFPSWHEDLGPELLPYAAPPSDQVAQARLIAKLLDDPQAWAKARTAVRRVAERYPTAEQESARLIDLYQLALQRL